MAKAAQNSISSLHGNKIIKILQQIAPGDCLGCAKFHSARRCDPAAYKHFPMCNGADNPKCKVRQTGHQCPFVGENKWLNADGSLYQLPNTLPGCTPPPSPRGGGYDTGGRRGFGRGKTNGSYKLTSQGEGNDADTTSSKVLLPHYTVCPIQGWFYSLCPIVI